MGVFGCTKVKQLEKRLDEVEQELITAKTKLHEKTRNEHEVQLQLQKVKLDKHFHSGFSFHTMISRYNFWAESKFKLSASGVLASIIESIGDYFAAARIGPGSNDLF